MDITEQLHSLFNESEIKNGYVYFPDWGRLVIRPNVDELRNNAAILSFKLSCSEWDRDLYECSVGMGGAQDKAVGMALGSFAFGMMDGVKKMQKAAGHSCGGCTCELSDKHLESEFAGARHKWHVFEGNIVGMGNGPKDMPSYWDLISDEVTKRLGNQKVCYVKVYAAKSDGDITGECRINDVASPELGQIIAEHIQTWDTDGFCSQKQFIFLVQDDDTYVSYPYTQEDIADYTRQAIALFNNCGTDEEYDSYTGRLAAQIGDIDLAQELYMFLPEMCAENAFNKVSYGEDVGLYIGNTQKTVYKSQFASYYPILNALHAEFAGGRFTDALYSKYISVSSVYSVICKAREEGADLENFGKIFISYGAPEGYRLR